MPLVTLSIADARRLALSAQGLSGPRPRSTAAMLDQLGSVQLDTISVLARSHLLVAWARLGPTPRASIENEYWPENNPSTFEYWAHAACIIPIRRWPEFAFRRRAALRKGRRWHHLENPEHSLREIRAQLSANGPSSAAELGGTKKGGLWWDWTESKIAVEYLLDTGEVVCVARRGWRRIYDLAERAVPAELLQLDFDDAACHVLMLREAARALGVATLHDLARHQKMTLAEVRPAIEAAGLREVRVGSDKVPWYAPPEALDALSGFGRTRTTLLSPFDSLLWERPRVAHLFGVEHRLEAYVPKAKRVHGYYAMPVLAGIELVATVDPAREDNTLVVRHISLKNRAAIPQSAVALVRASRWISARRIRIERVSPPEMAGELSAVVRELSGGLD